ncbi:hypothetical protein RHDE110596_13955 [Prescottella defluvii]
MRIVRPLALTVMVSAIALGAYGAGLFDVGGSAPARPTAEVVSAAVCEIPFDLVGIATAPVELTPQSPARRGTVPRDFVPVSALTCDPYAGPTLSADLVVVATAHRWEGDFTAAVRKLNAPSEGRRLLQGGCPVAGSVRTPDLWLVDAGGRALRPSYPVDDCGFRRIGGLAEIEALTEVETIEYRFTVAPPAAAKLHPCVAAVPEPTVGSAVAGTAELEGLTAVYSVCDYRRRDGAWVFDGARRLEGSVEMPDARPAPGECPDATRAVGALATPLAYGAAPFDVLVELDGCRRILMEGRVPIAAPVDLVAALS